jgi:hypothetical protein
MKTSSPVAAARGRGRSLSEARELIAAWQASELKIRPWCREQGVAYSALKSWRGRVADADRAPPTSGFIAMHPPHQAAPSVPTPSALIVELGDGLRVRGLDVAGVAALVCALRAGGR